MSAPAVATRQSKGRAQRAAAARVQADIVRSELDVFEQTLQKHVGRQGSGRALASNTSEMENNEQQRAASARSGRRNTQLTDKAGESNTMLRSAILQSLSRTAAFDPHEQHSLLHESLRLQEAARWLLQCPRHTLHVLQQRVLCAAQDYVMTFASVPPYLKPYVALLNAHAAILSDNHGKVLTPTGRNENKNTAGMHTWRQSQKEHDNNDESDDEDDEGTALPIPPPAPLPFLTFLTDFILGDDIEDTQEEEEGDSNDNDTKMKTTTTVVAVSKSRSVLCTGRPQPVATLSSANLIYGLPTIERVLYTTQQQQPTSATQDATKTGSNTGANKGGGQKKRTAAAQSNTNAANDGQGGNSVYVWMERHQDVMADLVQWGEFFSSFFDEAREGFCREPVSLMCAVLLACGLLAHCELNDSLAAQTRRTLHALRSEPSVTVTHFNTCDACRARQAAIETESCERLRQEEKTCRAGKPTTTRSTSAKYDVSVSASTRLFHGTAAVVLWIETFLVLYRNGGRTGPTGTAAITTTSRSRAEEHTEDTMRAAEVYLVRDWIAQQAALDVLSFEAQAFDGELRLPLSCASDAPVRRLSFTRDGVARAVAAVTAWADECVTSGRPLATSVLLGLLREHLPVTAYYMTYFLPLQVPYCE